MSHARVSAETPAGAGWARARINGRPKAHRPDMNFATV